MNMSKGQLIADLADLRNLSKPAATETVDAFLNLIRGAAEAGDKVIIQGFGTFQMKTRSARTGRNPQTGLPVEIPASTVLTFKAAKPKA
jgi:DNA-binding protein HU-beta